MGHQIGKKKSLLLRVRRMNGQTAALERTLTEGTAECEAVLQQVSAIRGAVDALLTEILHDHLLNHIAVQKSLAGRQRQVIEISKILKSYLK